jgi:WD40 repeat protein
VLNREGGVDKKTIEKLFSVFELKIDKSDYLNSNTHLDWEQATPTPVFYGRKQELATLEHWILNERCRLVAILGMGGIGKTTLSIKLAQTIQQDFEYVIWRSLQEAPPIKNILANLIQILSQEQETESKLSPSTSDHISRLLNYLQNHRCLLILDNIETILRSGSRAGQYREGYEGYGQILQRIAQAAHQSCLVLTNREKPQEIALLAGQALPVRSLQLGGLHVVEGLEILKSKGLAATPKEYEAIIQRYAGNPLALKIAATTIEDVFDGNITEFLQQETAVFGDIRDILEQQFNRLSDLEKEIIYWLAINREPVTISQLREDMASPVPSAKLLEAVESLGRRSLIEKNRALFTLQPVVMEYVTNKFIELVCEEINNQNINLFKSHALIKATAKDYIRENQVRLILKPVIDGLLAALKSKKNIENQLTKILTNLQKTSPQEPSYTGGNIFNLLRYLETNLNGYDFSYLSIWQADLRNINLHNANFAHADLAKSVFIETLGGIHAVTFTPDGKLLATGDSYGDVRIYQVTDIKQLLICSGHTDWLWSVAFSPDGNILASSSKDQTIKLWDVSTGQCLKTLQGHTGGVWSIAFCPQGNDLIASGSEDQTVKLWNFNTGQCLKTLQGHADCVYSVFFSPNGETLVSGSDDQTIKLWDVSTGSCILTLRGHTSRVWSVAFNSNNHMIASGSSDQTVRLWDISTGQCLKTLQGYSSGIWALTFSCDGRMLVSGSGNHTVKFWDTDSGECFKTLPGHSNRVTTVALNSKDLLLATGSEDQTVKLWDLTTNQCLKTLRGHSNWITSVTISPTNELVASSSDDQTVRLWDINTGQCIHVLEGHTDKVWSVAFNPNEQILASGSIDQTVKFWDVNTGKCIQTLKEHEDLVWTIAYSPDGRLLASASSDQTIKLWNTTTGECFRTLKGHTSSVYCVAFSPDGSILASTGEDQTVRLWNVATGQCLKTLKEHTQLVWSVAFHPNGQILASGSQDDTIKIWDINAGKCLEDVLKVGGYCKKAHKAYAEICR